MLGGFTFTEMVHGVFRNDGGDMTQNTLQLTCEVCGDTAKGTPERLECKNCGSEFRQGTGMHIRLSGEQCRKLVNQVKPIETYFGDSRVICIQAKSVKTGNVRHWVCKTPQASRVLKDRLEKMPKIWQEVSGYHAHVYDEGDSIL